jgi:hypothetical protein
MALLNEEEAAKLIPYNPSPTTLASWRAKGRGPEFYKVGGRVFYDDTDVDRWVHSQRIDAAQRRAERKARAYRRSRR